jgi:O-antigen biosynthesis protein
MPVFNTDDKWLREAIESVLAQLYPNWELCIADDASPRPHVRRTLQEYAARDSRIKVVYRPNNGHISAATNSALALASGEFVSLMDHDDVIPQQALYELVNKLNQDPAVDMIYSDEDKIDTKGRRFDPAFKPDWSPDYLESCMYTAHLALYRKAIADEIGGFRPGYDGAQDYDFVLRFTEKTDRIAHVSRVLYHWRAIPGSTATSMYDKSYVIAAGVRALRDRLERTGRSGSVSQSRYPGCFDVRVTLAEHPLVSIVIPTAGRDRKVHRRIVNLVSHCVGQIRSLSTYPNYEIVIVDNGDLGEATRKCLATCECHLIAFGEPEFNISKKLNLGASIASGSYLLFLNDDTEVVRGDWIQALLEQFAKPGVGAVGAKLLYENDTLQHVGVAHHQGLPDHVRKHFPRSDPGYMFSTVSVRNYLAVTGACLLTRSDLFHEVSGFNESYRVNYSDIDYCLKLRALGYRSVYTPHAELYHFESASRAAVVAKEEIELYLQRWKTVTTRDPYYNADYFRTSPPNFSLRLSNSPAEG